MAGRKYAKILNIIDSDEFLKLPVSTQAYYLHLVMRADGKGVVKNPKAMVRALNVDDIDLTILTDRGFLSEVEDGVKIGGLSNE